MIVFIHQDAHLLHVLPLVVFGSAAHRITEGESKTEKSDVATKLAHNFLPFPWTKGSNTPYNFVFGKQTGNSNYSTQSSEKRARPFTFPLPSSFSASVNEVTILPVLANSYTVSMHSGRNEHSPRIGRGKHRLERRHGETLGVLVNDRSVGGRSGLHSGWIAPAFHELISALYDTPQWRMRRRHNSERFGRGKGRVGRAPSHLYIEYASLDRST